MSAVNEPKDILGKPLQVGDLVAMSSYNNLVIAFVDKINPKMIRVKRPDSNWTQNKYSRDLIKIDDRDAVVYLLKN